VCDRLTFCTAPSKPASKSRHLKRGVKEVVKSIRKGEKAVQNVSRGAENGGDVTTSSEPAGLSRHA
jgi:hypothetical protein